MELYVMNNKWERTAVYDAFESLIWTERWAGWGDFELHVPSTPETRAMFTRGTRLGMNLSYRVMLVETVEGKYDGSDELIVKGRSLESILEYRVARNSMANLTTQPNWIINDEPVKVAEKMLNDAFLTGSLSTNDALPYVFKGSFFPVDTISPIETNPIKWEQPLATLYDAVTSICNQYELGFRLVRQDSGGSVFCAIYTGSDRTTTQRLTTLKPIVFSRALDNFDNMTELSTNENARNVAYVFSPQGSVVVYANGATADTYGLDRRVMFIQADAVPNTDYPTATDITNYLTRVGTTELAQRRPTTFFDGEITRANPYVYQSDYWLGDIVEIRNVDDERLPRRVTEQIFVSDGEGERSYPTLSATIVR